MHATASVVSEVSQLGAAYVPQLVALSNEWQRLFMGPAPEPALAASEAAGPTLGEAAKEAMLVESLQDLAGAYIETCRRRLQQDAVQPEQLLAGLRSLLGALGQLHQLVPQAKLEQRAVHAAEHLAKRSVDAQLQSLQSELAALVTEFHAARTPAGASLQGILQKTGARVAGLVQDSLSRTAPLVVPLCKLLGLRADGMATYLVARLYCALHSVASITLEPCADPAGMLVRAGMCLGMASTAVPQVPTMLKVQLTPHGLSNAALGFDAASMSREIQASADTLLERFVEVQAHRLSVEVTKRMRAADWLQCPPPREVTHLVEAALLELRAMQALAVQVFLGESPRSLLSQVPFPGASSAVQLPLQRSQLQASSTAIQKDLQRMFARKVSFGRGTGAAKLSVASMLTQVAKLMLKTLVEEVRLATFSRAGFQQLQVDVGMLRWLLPPVVDDEGAIVALLDEALFSCQERCLDCVAVDHARLETLCGTKRKELLLRLV